MQKQPSQNGLKTLVREYRKQFRIPENLDHYSDEDYRNAEQKYIKLCVTRGVCDREPR